MAKIDWTKTPIRPTGYDAEGNTQWGIREETLSNGRRVQQVTTTTARMELTRGQWTLVDIEDLPKLKLHSWYAHWDGQRRYYAKAKIDCKTVLMSRFILGYKGDNDVDHINQDSLDNRKENLQDRTRSQNSANNASDGTRYQSGRWQARVWHYGKCYSATFSTKEEALAWRVTRKKELSP